MFDWVETPLQSVYNHEDGFYSLGSSMVSNKDDRGQQALITGDISPKNGFYSLELKIKA